MDYPIPKNSGLLSNPFDPRDIWLDEILGGVDSLLPSSYVTKGLAFEGQGGTAMCVSFCATKMVEYAVKQKTSINYDLSQPHLFYWAGGSPAGSTFRGNLDVARERGCISYAKCPMPDDIWNVDFYALQRKALDIPFASAKKVKGYARVDPSRDALKRALISHGMILVGVAASGGWWKPFTKRSTSVDNHAVLLVGWNEDDSWIVFDSLQPDKDFNGYHSLDASYTFNSAYVITELPEDWKETVLLKRSEDFQVCLNHYGKPRDFEAEQRAAVTIIDAFKQFNNQAVFEAAGRFFTALVNAYCYGGYNLTYKKWGMTQPGDLYNFVFHFKRTGQYIFDLNKLRSEYP